jgi:hypothetical protein
MGGRIRRNPHTSRTSHPGRLFAAAATVVTAPRLVLAFLVGDGIAVPESVRIVLLSASSVATAIALTGGAAYLAHAITVARSDRRILSALWVATVACSSALMAPLIAAGLPRSLLAAVLRAPAHRWIWAVCAVLAVDLVAAAAMRADAEQSRDRERRDEEHQRAIAELLRQRDSARADALQAQSAQALAPRQTPGAAPQQPAMRARGAGTASGRKLSGASAHRCVCGRRFDSQPSLAAHMRWCPVARAPGTPARTDPLADPDTAPVDTLLEERNSARTLPPT